MVANGQDEPVEPSSGRFVLAIVLPTVPEGLLARGLLQAEGIPVLTKGEGEGPYRMGPVELWVPEGFEVQARLLVESPPASEGSEPVS